MAEISVKKLRAAASTVIDDVETGAAYIVTKRGRPAAVILPVEEAEDFVLANADEHIWVRRLARSACYLVSDWPSPESPSPESTLVGFALAPGAGPGGGGWRSLMSLSPEG